MGEVTLAPGVVLVQQDAAAVLPTLANRGFSLVHSDPPWSYANSGRTLQGIASREYAVLALSAIVDHLNLAWAAASENAYLLLWCTWPKLFEWRDASRGNLKWRYTSGGAWAKTGRMGVGFHWRGDSEPLLLYAKGAPKPQHRKLSNTYISDRSRHSEKPETFLRRCVEGFSPVDGSVLDVYAGLAPMARACAGSGRGYLGVEVDGERIAEAAERFGGREVERGEEEGVGEMPEVLTEWSETVEVAPTAAKRGWDALLSRLADTSTL